MNAELDRLISDYLAGRASEPDVRRLEALILSDPEASRQLLFASAMETNLGQLMCGPSQRAPRTSTPSHSWLAFFAFAAVVLLALAGFTAAVFLFNSRAADRRQIADLQSRLSQSRIELASLEQTQARPLLARDNPSTRIIDTRGLVLLFSDKEKPVQVNTGASVPEGRTLWTCPWGGVETRLADDTSISLERSTTASFSESQGARRINLKSGLLSVKRWPESADRGQLLVATANFEASIANGQLTVVAAGAQTTFEVGMGRASIKRLSDGKTITLSEGEYTVAGKNADLNVVKGLLRWTLEPAQDSPGSSTIN